MTAKDLSSELLSTLQDYYSLGIKDQIKYDKFYLYSIITHSTAIEGSTVTEVEAQLLFDEGITSSKRTITEQMMNLDFKKAYVQNDTLNLTKKRANRTANNTVKLNNNNRANCSEIDIQPSNSNAGNKISERKKLA